ncbi:MAG: class I SAM-dependent methyltransferase [Candidatus Thermoplasmatota archaeon]|nr:class I SAM-dependent methyltransferase [Candidatus Thermoplasmatota archaeon]
MSHIEEDPWEKEYSQKGQLWSGRARDLPALPTSSRVLELGCGNGKNLEAMAKRGWEVVGVDTSHSAIELCKQRLSNLDRPPLLMVADARHLPFPDNDFHCVFAIHLLGHLDSDDGKVVLGEMMRVLKPGGLCHVVAFSIHDARCGKGEEVGSKTFRKGTGIITKYYEREELFVEIKEATGQDAAIRVSSWEANKPPNAVMREELVGEWSKPLQEGRWGG